MIGRRLDANFPPKSQPDPDAPEVLSVEGLTRRGAFHDVTFSVREGEIVVLTGLVGAGRSEVARAIYGADRVDSGAVRVHGQPLRARHPTKAIRRGVAMIPEARTSEGLQLTRPVRENITLPYLDGLSTAGVVRRRREARLAGEAITQTGIKASSQDAAVVTLSGGNQQKVLFARSLFGTPALLIADEPTRGVDVGAKRAIYDLMTRASRERPGSARHHLRDRRSPGPRPSSDRHAGRFRCRRAAGRRHHRTERRSRCVRLHPRVRRDQGH